MAYRSIIDEALAKARAKAGGTEKTAASEELPLVKQANELADALEFVALSATDDGTPAGEHRQSLLGDYFKRAAAGGPPESETGSRGTQDMPPSSGKTHIQPAGKPSDARPAESEAPDGPFPRSLMEQQAPAVKKSPTEPANSKKASLYDLITAAAERVKEAAKGGPADSEALDDQAAPPRKNENVNIDLLRSNEAPVRATKRQAKLPTRARLKKLFAGASDTIGDATAKAVWPQAAAKGSIKVAGPITNFVKKGGEDDKGKKDDKDDKDDKDEAPEKKGSLAEWSSVFQAMQGGQLGEQAKAFSEFIEEYQVGT